MSAIAQTEPQLANFDQLKDRLKATWMTGDYDLFSRFLEKDAVRFYRRLRVKPGARLLDVACGSGQIALIAARKGADATGCDIAINWVEKARTRAIEEDLPVTFDEGDAEGLPYADAQFDVVVSLFGAMFAPRPELVAAEMVRVCRPGGTVAMGNWTPRGFVGQMFQVIARHIAPNGMPSPALWGDEATVRERFAKRVVRLRCTPQLYCFDYPFPPEGVVDFFRTNYGPMSRAFASLDAAGQENLRNELAQLWSTNNRSPDGGTIVDAEYLQVVGKNRS